MPGIPTSFVILEQTVKQLQDSGDASQQAIADAITGNWQYAYLGSVGPSIGDFLPSQFSSECITAVNNQSKSLIPISPSECNLYLVIWHLIFGLVGGNEGLLSVINQLNSFLAEAAPIIAAQDTSALASLVASGQVHQLQTIATQLQTQIGLIKKQVQALAQDIADMRPVINGSANPPPPAPSLPSEGWAVRDFLHWKKTGQFAQALLNNAQSSGDPRFIAYAYGYLTGYAGKICGSAFINSIVGGPYRTQWWRHRWVNNYVDAWVYGYYNLASPPAWTGEIPNPNYDSWPSLCSANLHQNITLPDATAIDPQTTIAAFGQWPPSGFSSVLPHDFYDFWIGAYQDVYGSPPTALSLDNFNGAYILTWLVLWFQTSTGSLGCNPAPPMTPPGNCGSKPGWVQPAAEPGDNGSGQTPPVPNPDYTVSKGESFCGLLLEALGVISFVFGNPFAGLINAAGSSLFWGGIHPNWTQLQCTLYWYQLYVYNGLEDIHQLGVIGAFLYPYASELAVGQTSIPFLPTIAQWDSGTNLVVSKPSGTGNAMFPSLPGDPFNGNWVVFPNSGAGNDPGIESAIEVAYLDDGEFPSWFVTDNPAAARVRSGGSWPVAKSGGLPVEFGSVVTEAVDLLTHPGSKLPDFNLDADRGQAFFTWQLQPIPPAGIPEYTNPIAIEPES